MTRSVPGSVPRMLYLPAVIGLALLNLPIIGLIARVDWATVPAAIASPAAADALWLSLRTGFAATLVCLVLGVPLAVVMARSGPRLAGILRAVTTLPLVLPPMVGGRSEEHTSELQSRPHLVCRL